MAGLGRTIPALPVRDVRAAASWMASHFGFTARHVDDGFAVVARDDAVLHLWGASDEGWRARSDLPERPVCSGAESFIAGTASCRIEVGDPRGVDALFGALRDAGVIHPTAKSVEDTDFGTREFHTLDRDGNLLTFFAVRSDGS
jgi:catechol 2,3-dioxygenase-like lactoylglutathione lyase family enzyme